MIPGIELAACGPLAVPHEVMEHVIHVESSRNPFAIGVVGGRLLRQPRNLAEAAATVRMLEANGHNYSIGLAQVNRVNFARFGLDTPEQGFDVCNNLAAGAKILAECLQRHDGRWGDAFSCYYSGNARTGYEHGYVQKVFGAMAASRGAATSGGADAIPLAPASGAPASQARPDGTARAPLSPDSSADGWGAILAARISAPEARRAQPVEKAEPVAAEASFVSAVEVNDPSGRSRSKDASSAASAGTAAVSPAPMRAPDGEASLTPEARFVLEMQQRISVEAPPSAVPAPVTETTLAESASDTAVENQQSSNSQAEDAARVF